MKNKCDCYIEDRQLADYTPLMKPIYKTISLCNGTKERDMCSCGGDRTKCDFYPEVREKAKKELNTDADTVKVIRCKNCKHGRPNLFAIKHKKSGRIVTGTDFNYSPPRQILSDYDAPILFTDYNLLHEITRRKINLKYYTVMKVAVVEVK